MAGRLEVHNAEDTEGLVAIPGRGIVLAAGETVPADGAAGYAPGCIFIVTDDTPTMNTTTYTNIGTNASCNFDAQVNA